MTTRYDPHTPPDADLWQGLDEDEQVQLVLAYHRAAGDVLPNPRAHAALHVVVENQIALGQTIPVAATLIRLQNEGLDRHEAIHAVASVLAGHMKDLLTTGELGGDPNREYYERLGGLTAEGWRREFG